MKKTILSILIGGMLMTSSYAKTLVCYFSCTGNTKALAQTAAKVLQADLFEIEAAVPYTAADLDWHDGGSRTTKESKDKTIRPAIKAKPNLAAYDTVVLAFPIYWYTAPSIMFTFVEENDLSGKNVVAICTSGGSGIGGAESDLKKLASKTAVWKRGEKFSASTGESELKQYFDRVLK